MLGFPVDSSTLWGRGHFWGTLVLRTVWMCQLCLRRTIQLCIGLWGQFVHSPAIKGLVQSKVVEKQLPIGQHVRCSIASSGVQAWHPAV